MAGLHQINIPLLLSIPSRSTSVSKFVDPGPYTSHPNDMSVEIPHDFGLALVGGLVSAMLYGITTLQTYIYYMHYSDDASTMKSVVAAIWILDTLHVSFMCHILYHYLITNYGVPTSLEYIVWSSPASTLVNGVLIFVVQW